MDKNLSLVLITGGTKRIGFHLAKTALEMGFGVILHYRTSNAAAKTWLQKNPHYKNRVFFITGDLTDTPENILEQATVFPGTLVGLVNNASLFSTGNMYNITHFEAMLDIHVNVPARLGTRFAQLTRTGWIINMTDAITAHPHVNFQNYRISKFFLNELTRQQAYLFAPGIRVNAIAPGAILSATGDTPERFADLRHHIPLKRTGKLRDIAAGFRFLVTNDYCTGQILSIDGGWHIA